MIQLFLSTNHLITLSTSCPFKSISQILSNDQYILVTAAPSLFITHLSVLILVHTYVIHYVSVRYTS